MRSEMNREQIIQMAQESPLVIDSNISERIWQFNAARLERFAALVAANEREECAKLCEKAIDSIWEYHPESEQQIGRNVCINLAVAIRASVNSA